MDAETAAAIRALSDSIRKLSAEITDLKASMNALDHDMDSVFERISESDDVDDDNDGAYRTCVLDWKYDISTGKIKVLYGTLLEDGTFEPDSTWSDAPGSGPYGGGGTETVEEDW